MPNQPKTPKRGFRIPTDLYEAAQAKAADEGRTVSDVVRDALTRYVQGGTDSTHGTGRQDFMGSA
ncbi:CopG family transcriptional regulator [Herbiconiux sp. VKM Ac-1786]|uniref:ribbon-helix-helix protein, CopG family n=1 Tax=Herbiconiux sp. VKM Ac-1786 TaxID=2783824 RepID=UPI00188A823E|nr:CopG family transcriptional regulator [Herbiconiux sp. VKM Ac-1786]